MHDAQHGGNEMGHHQDRQQECPDQCQECRILEAYAGSMNALKVNCKQPLLVVG
jgi:hypothetical protein